MKQPKAVQSIGQKLKGWWRWVYGEPMVYGSGQKSSPLADDPNICKSYKDLTLGIFRACLVHEHYHLLSRNGVMHEPEALHEAWMVIFSEYIEHIGGSDITNLIRSTASINVLSCKIDRITLLVEALRFMPSEAIILELSKEGYKAQCSRLLAATEEDEYHAALDSIESKLKTELVRLDQMKSDRDKPTNHKITEDDFDQTVLAIEDMMRFSIPDTITVYKYCQYVRKLHAKMKAVKSVNKK